MRPMTADDRHETIMIEAQRLIHDRGYHAVSIRDLAKAVGVKMSSLYYYFESKEQILYAISRRTMERIIDATEVAVAAHSEAGAAQRLAVAISTGVEFHIVHQAAAGVVLSEARSLTGPPRAELRRLTKAYETIFRALVEEGMAAGTFEPGDPVMATYIILSALTRISIWHRPGGRLSSAEIAEHYSTLLVRMLLTTGDRDLALDGDLQTVP